MLKLLVAAPTMAAAGFAQAQIYGRVDAGWSTSHSSDIQDRNFAADRTICADAACTIPGTIDDVGSSGLVSGGVGWRFNPNFRSDVTLGYRGWFKIDETTPGSVNIKADVKSLALMLNGYYDFNMSSSFDFYIGAGIGAAANKLEDPVRTVPGQTRTGPGGTKQAFA